MESEEVRTKIRISSDQPECIICQGDISGKKLVSNPRAESLKKLFSCVKERAGYADAKVLRCWERIKTIEVNEFVNSSYYYHKYCYKLFTNATDIKRSKERFVNKSATLKGELSSVTNESNPETEQIENTQSGHRKSLRSVSIYDKNSCIICQKEGGRLHKVSLKSTGEKMLEVAKQLSDRAFFLRLHTIPNASDAVANDVQYHLTCWVLVQRSVISSSATFQDLEKILTGC